MLIPSHVFESVNADTLEQNFPKSEGKTFGSHYVKRYDPSLLNFDTTDSTLHTSSLFQQNAANENASCSTNMHTFHCFSFLSPQMHHTTH